MPRLRDSTCTAGSHVEKWRSFLEWCYLIPVLGGLVVGGISQIFIE